MDDRHHPTYPAANTVFRYRRLSRGRFQAHGELVNQIVASFGINILNQAPLYRILCTEPIEIAEYSFHGYLHPLTRSLYQRYYVSRDVSVMF